MEKVKITRAQADAIEFLIAKNDSGESRWEVEPLIRVHAQNANAWAGEADPIRHMPLLTLVDALRIGYEVKETFKAGDWVVHEAGCKLGQIEIVRGKYIMVRRTDGEGYWWNTDHIRHATPEEIKAGQECRVWAKTGRKVGEFKDGDIGVCEHIYWNDPDDLKNLYKEGILENFYPVESRISFGGGEE